MAPRALSDLVAAYISHHPLLLSGGLSYLFHKHAIPLHLLFLCLKASSSAPAFSPFLRYQLKCHLPRLLPKSDNPNLHPCSTHTHLFYPTAGFYHGTYIFQRLSVFNIYIHGSCLWATCHSPLAHPVSNLQLQLTIPCKLKLTSLVATLPSTPTCCSTFCSSMLSGPTGACFTKAQAQPIGNEGQLINAAVSQSSDGQGW